MSGEDLKRDPRRNPNVPSELQAYLDQAVKQFAPLMGMDKKTVEITLTVTIPEAIEILQVLAIRRGSFDAKNSTQSKET